MATLLYLATGEGVITVKGASGAWALGERRLNNWNVNEVAVQPSANSIATDWWSTTSISVFHMHWP